MHTQATELLLPCPFCGGAGEARVKQLNSTYVTVECPRCIYSLPAHTTSDKAIAAWNRRTQDAAQVSVPSSEVREAIRTMVSYCNKRNHTFGVGEASVVVHAWLASIAALTGEPQEVSDGSE